MAEFRTRHAFRLGAALLAVERAFRLPEHRRQQLQFRAGASVQRLAGLPGFDYYTGKTAIVYNVGFGAFNLGYVSLLNPGTQTITTDQTGTTQVLAAVNASLGFVGAFDGDAEVVGLLRG
jgi:hypothetical protein